MKSKESFVARYARKSWAADAALLMGGVLLPGVVLAQWATPGVNTQGSTGGLVIPSAEVRTEGDLALTVGGYQEPQLGSYATQQNFSLGLGLLPNVELYGRLTNYVNEVPGALDSGLRDLSANIKVKLPDFWERGPKFAIGINDLSGGAVNFKSDYVVATQNWQSWSVSAGYAQGKATSRQVFDGAFGGITWRVPGTGLSVLAEHDGLQKHIGARWQSAPIAAWGNLQVMGTVQRAIDAKTLAGANADSTKMAFTLLIPFGRQQQHRERVRPAPVAVAPVVVQEPVAAGVVAQDPSELAFAKLSGTLSKLGLERVRVGQRDHVLGKMWVVEYENHRYAHNESDAIGLVLGWAAKLAPASVQRVQAITLKNGLPMVETSVGAAAYRDFLVGGSASQVVDSLVVDLNPGARLDQVQWLDGKPGDASRVRIEVKPDLKYTLGTEVGLFDYALAANLQATVPLWRGAKFSANYVAPIAHSRNVNDGGAFSNLRQTTGLKSVSVGQTYWFGSHLLAHLDVGRFQYDVNGAQLQALGFIPNSGDTVRLRGAAYDRAPGGIAGQERGMGVISYRHQWSPSTWLEAGAQRYSDGSSGPTVEWTRWFGDFSAQVYYRQGGSTRFAGMQLSFPLTPRRGMKPSTWFVTGPSQYAQSLRTFLTDSNQPANLVWPGAVQDLKLETNMDVDLLNGGRLNQKYLETQLTRMREAFTTYAGEAGQ